MHITKAPRSPSRFWYETYCGRSNRSQHVYSHTVEKIARMRGPLITLANYTCKTCLTAWNAQHGHPLTAANLPEAEPQTNPEPRE
jgi:hypothetical protein